VALNTKTIPPHPHPKPGPGFLSSYVSLFFTFNDFRQEVVVEFVDFGGLVDHHCLNSLFIKIIFLIISRISDFWVKKTLRSLCYNIHFITTFASTTFVVLNIYI
jgi:hypothetical protein